MGKKKNQDLEVQTETELQGESVLESTELQTDSGTGDLPESEAVLEEMPETEAEEFEDETAEVEAATMRTLSPARLVLKRFFRSKLSITGLVILIFLFVFSFLGPVFKFFPFIWGEQQMDEDNRVAQEYVSVPYEMEGEDGETYTVYVITYSEPGSYLSPSATHWLGTDDLGFDVFSRLMYGGRISLTVGFVVVILETLVGVLFGGLAGYFGKWVDQLIMR
ncbi:MAG: hypothetical protein K2K12_04045, partial [Clostridia bacterium]|nr:hypothetical protein [Clostridia bacterium]